MSCFWCRLPLLLLILHFNILIDFWKLKISHILTCPRCIVYTDRLLAFTTINEIKVSDWKSHWFNNVRWWIGQLLDRKTHASVVLWLGQRKLTNNGSLHFSPKTFQQCVSDERDFYTQRILSIDMFHQKWIESSVRTTSINCVTRVSDWSLS